MNRSSAPHLSAPRAPRRSRLLMLALPALMVLAVTLASTLQTQSSEAAGPALIAIDTDPATPGIQSTAEFPQGTDPLVIDVVVQNADSIGAFEFYLAFDVIWLEFLRWQPGPFLGSTGRPIYCFQVISENTLRLGCASNGISPDGPSGDGVLATLYFHPRITGQTCFRMLLVETAEELGHALPTDREGGCVTTIPHTATPTATATSTATPTSTHTPPSTATRTPTASATSSATATQPAASATPRTPESATRTTTPSTATPPAVSTVLVGTAAPDTSPTLVSTVLSTAPRPPSGPTGFPRAGASGGIAGARQSWLISAMSLTIGVLLVLLLRRTFSDDDQQTR